VKFFLKPSWTLFLIGIGILLFILGLVAIYTLTGKTESELLSGYAQKVQIDQPQVETVYAAPTQSFYFELSDKNSPCGEIGHDDFVFTLYKPLENSQLIRLEDVRGLELRENTWPADSEKCELIIPIKATLPDDLVVGTKLEGNLEGSVSIQQSTEDVSSETEMELSRSITVEVVSQADLLKQVRKQPLLIIIFSFPFAIAMIVLGARSELYGSKRSNSTAPTK